MNPVGDATRRFSDRVDAYVRSRPGYPAALIELLARDTGLGPEHLVIDLGCGTGLSSLPFATHGNRVIGIEPNRAMREAGARLLADHADFRMVGGTAEAIPLADGVADYVIAGQAFHWFDPERARDSARRVLRAGGWAVVFWNTRLLDRTPFLVGYEALLLQFGTDYREVSALAATGSRLIRFFGGEPARRVLPNAQRLDLEGLKERLRSASYTPAPGQPGYEPMMAAAARLFETHQAGGRVVLEYDLEVYFGRLHVGGGSD